MAIRYFFRMINRAAIAAMYITNSHVSGHRARYLFAHATASSGTTILDECQGAKPVVLQFVQEVRMINRLGNAQETHRGIVRRHEEASSISRVLDSAAMGVQCRDVADSSRSQW
jgi:hypothetical protein